MFGTALTWIHSFLTNRPQSIKIRNCFSEAVLWHSPRLCSCTAVVYSVYNTTKLIHSHKLDHQLKADGIQVYISLYTADTGNSVSVISLAGWQTIDLGSMETKQISLLLVHPDNAANLLVSSLRPSLIMASHLQTLYIMLVLHLIAILISENLFLWHVAAASTISITSRLDYCNSHLYNIATKDIAKFQCVQKCLARVVTRSYWFSHSVPLLKSLHCSISHRFQILHHCLSNSFFQITFMFIYFLCFL